MNQTTADKIIKWMKSFGRERGLIEGMDIDDAKDFINSLVSEPVECSDCNGTGKQEAENATYSYDCLTCRGEKCLNTN
jgi:hypothetical protein